MEKNKFIIGFVIIVFSIFVVNGELVDNFDRANNSTLGTATNGNVWEEIVSNGDWEIFNNSLKGSNSVAGNTIANIALNDVSPFQIDFQIRWNHACSGDLGSYFITYDTSSANTDWGIQLNWCKSSDLEYHNGVGWISLSTPFTYSANTWYNMSFRGCTYSGSYHCDLYIDNVLHQSSLVFRNNVVIQNLTHWTSILTAGKYMEIDNLTTNGDFFSAGASDSCTPPSINNNWTIAGGDNCSISSQTIDLGIGGIYFTGNGTITFTDSVVNVAFFEREAGDGGVDTQIYLYNTTVTLQ